MIIVGGSISLWKNREDSSSSSSNMASSLTQLSGFAVLAAFIKGIGGSGYGPLLTIGQITSGVYEKSAIGIMPIAESGVATVGILSFYIFPSTIDMFLLPSIFTGSYFAAILSPYLVRCIPNKLWSYIVPVSAFGIGTITLLKTVFF